MWLFPKLEAHTKDGRRIVYRDYLIGPTEVLT